MFIVVLLLRVLIDSNVYVIVVGFISISLYIYIRKRYMIMKIDKL